jgi:hypothetical protein
MRVTVKIAVQSPFGVIARDFDEHSSRGFRVVAAIHHCVSTVGVRDNDAIYEGRGHVPVSVQVGFMSKVCSTKEAWWHTTERNPIP